MSAPTPEIGGAKAAHVRLLWTAARLSDDQVCHPSRLPGWTSGHLVTHLARNADGHVGQFEAAAKGEVAQQYPGGQAQRAADIEAGAGRPAGELVADLTGAIGRLEEAWGSLPDGAWRDGQGLAGAATRSMPELVYRRWREVEVHHVDLGMGFGPPDWTPGFVERELGRLILSLPGRLPPGMCLAVRATDRDERWVLPRGGEPTDTVTADGAHLVAWLLGRTHEPDLPLVAPWE